MSPIFVAPLWVSCLSAGFPLQRVVWADPVDSSGDAGGAPPRSEQPPHAVPNVALPWPLMLWVTPTGQVTVRLTSSTAKSSMLNPPGTAAPGCRLWCPGAHALPESHGRHLLVSNGSVNSAAASAFLIGRPCTLTRHNEMSDSPACVATDTKPAIPVTTNRSNRAHSWPCTIVSTIAATPPGGRALDCSHSEAKGPHRHRPRRRRNLVGQVTAGSHPVPPLPSSGATYYCA